MSEEEPLMKGKKKKKKNKGPITRTELDDKVAGSVSGSVVTVPVAELGVDSEKKLQDIELHVQAFYKRVVERETTRKLIGASKARLAADNWAYTPQMEQLTLSVNAKFGTYLTRMHVWHVLLSCRKDGEKLAKQSDTEKDWAVRQAALDLGRKIAQATKMLAEEVSKDEAKT